MSVSYLSIQENQRKSNPKNQPRYLWPEWTDSEYNSIRMEPFNKDKPILEKNLYFDQETFFLPDILQSEVANWVRTYDYFKSASEITLFQEYEPYKFPNLFELNRHLMCSPLMRLIISSFGVLQYFGDRYTNKMPKFFQSLSNEPWRPWFHVYSCGKMKKDAPMEPTWNANGVCVARLFYGGSWILIRMDDFIPIDRQGRALLPMVTGTDSSENVAILWPIFLTKALLKIAALTWTEKDEIVDFSPIHSIIGWVYEKIDVRGVDKKTIWEMCRPYATAYTWPEDEPGQKGSKKLAKSKGKSTPITVTKPNTATSVIIEKQMFLCLLINDIHFSDYGNSQLSPCFGHLCYVERTRNCVLEKPEKMPELEPWKKHRWVEWARERKIYPADPYAESTYAFEILSTFRRSLAPAVDFEIEVNPPPSRATNSPPSGKSGKSGKSSKKSKAAESPSIPSPLLWCNFDQIFNYISELHLFFIPGTFQNNWLVTLKSDEKKSRPKSTANSVVSAKTDDKKSRKSVASAATIEDDKVETQILVWPNELLISKNTPIYLFIDSLSTKFLLFSLQHKCVKYTRPIMGTSLGSTVLQKTNNYRSKASVLIEKYTFESNEFGEVEFFLNTMGVAGRSLTIPQGRFIFRLWMKSETASNLYILSNTNFFMGKTIPILESMTKIPFRIQEYANSFSNAFSIYFNSIGYVDFKVCMRAFYQFIRPVNCTKKMKMLLYEKIVDILFDLCELCENPKETKYALSVLFGPRLSPTLIDEYSIENSAARKIQAMFRGFYVRRVLEKRFIDSKQYDSIQTSLREYYDKFFGVEQRNFNVPHICLALLKKTNIYDYDFYSDYAYYLTTYTFRSQQRIKAEPNSWAPLLLCKFYVPKTIFLRITMQSELSTQVIRVFDNDTGEEMPRFLDSVKAQAFNKNEAGYTIVAYGWNLEPTDIWDTAWILQIAHLITEDLDLNVLKCDFKECHKSQLEGIYVPNEANVVCGCFIRIKNNTTVVIRAGTTYDQAKIKVQLMTDTGTLIYELSGTHGVVFPPIALRHVGTPKASIRSLSPHKAKSIQSNSSDNLFEPAQPTQTESLDTFEPFKEIQDRQQIPQTGSKIRETRYYLKVELVDDSWPLTNTEWAAIQEYKRTKELKANYKEGKDNREGSAGSQRGINKKGNINKLAPLWTINIMSFDPVTLQQDNESDNRILHLKTNWEKINPGRFNKANKLRQELLKQFRRPSKQEEEDFYTQKVSVKGSSALFKKTSQINTPINQSMKVLEERVMIPKWKEDKLLNWKDYPTTSATYNFIKELLLEKNRHIMTTDKHWLKTREDEQKRHLFREYRVQDFQKRYRMMNNYMEYVLDDYAKRFGSVYDHLEENMLISEELMAEAYDVRKYIYEQEKPRVMSFSWGGV